MTGDFIFHFDVAVSAGYWEGPNLSSSSSQVSGSETPQTSLNCIEIENKD